MPLIESVLHMTKSAASMKSFVESKNFGNLLADIELEAAARAISHLPETVDVRSQVWNVVNHLETAHASALHSLKKQNAGWVVTFDLAYEMNENKIRLYQCLLAVCYAYLGEKALCLNALDTAKQSHELGKEKENWLLIAKMPTYFVSMFAVSAQGVFKCFTDPDVFERYVVSEEQLAVLEEDLKA